MGIQKRVGILFLVCGSIEYCGGKILKITTIHLILLYSIKTLAIHELLIKVELALDFASLEPLF
jgi:hypothetical protein